MEVTTAFEDYMSASRPSRSEGGNPNDLVSQVIDGKYRLEAVLGRGGMGVVYRATRIMIGDAVAVKIILPEHVSDQKSIQRFRREAQATALLKHPNAVVIYDFGTTSEGLVYLVMELVEGQSLRQIIKEQGPLSPHAASVVINQVCAALDEAHRRNIIHRDLKPDNIVITATTGGVVVKVLDFGLAKLLDPETTANNLTQTGTVMGTPYYMSPEQFLGENLDGRSDIYSLGIVLYEMLTGIVPFNSPTPTAVVVQHVNQPPAPLRSRNASIPPAVESVVLRALEKRREARQQTALALAQELSAAVRGEAPGHQASPNQITESLTVPASTQVAGSRDTVPTMALHSPPSGSNMFASVVPPPSTGVPPYSSGEIPKARSRKRLLTVVIACVFALGLVGGVTAWWLQAETPVEDTQQADESKKAVEKTQDNGNAQATQPDESEETQPKSADEEFAALRDRRRSASSLQMPQVKDDLKAAENRYPNDYRFPYERAKINIKGVTTHDEPFDLLFLAGRKAIENGKADEMLSEMEREKDADLRKLSTGGHGEWAKLKAALSKRDKTALEHDSH